MAPRAPARSAPIVSMPTAWSARCSPGGATIVRQLPLARASPRETWATLASSSRACSSGADEVEGEVLQRPEPDPVAGRKTAVLAVAAVVDRVGRAGEPVAMEGAVDDRRDPPAGDRVLAQLEQAGRHLSRRSPDGPAADSRTRSAPRRSGAGERRPRRSRAARSTAAVGDGVDRAGPASPAIDVETTPGMPHASISSKSPRSGSTFRAIPW